MRIIKTRSILILVIVIAILILYIIYKTLDYIYSPLMLYESDIYRYENVSLSKIRIPRLIHQTYKTHDIPAYWNSTVNSVIELNKNDFKYRRWSDIEIDEFVKEHEPEFYYKTYKNYRYQIQRIDTFRYVLMYHIGGIYIDMDNGCNRPFKDLVITLESLDPDAIHLAAFPQRPPFAVDNDLIISTANHPFHRQLISRLNLFNNNYIFHFWTIIISTGPVYIYIQEKFFSSSKESVVRLLDYPVIRPMFTRKEHGLTWVHRDAHFIINIGDKITILFSYIKIFLLIIILFILIKRYKQNKFSNFFIFITKKLIRITNQSRFAYKKYYVS